MDASCHGPLFAGLPTLPPSRYVAFIAEGRGLSLKKEGTRANLRVPSGYFWRLGGTMHDNDVDARLFFGGILRKGPCWALGREDNRVRARGPLKWRLHSELVIL